jgi:hypothetical protein
MKLSGIKSSKKFFLPLLLLGVLIGGISYLYATNEGVATELQQIRQPRPNSFVVGIDVSATISNDTLEKLKDAIIDRLRQFIGDEAVSYSIMSFGNPGCAGKSFLDVVSTKSPQDAVTFNWKVEEKIRNISIPNVEPTDTRPLTTPLYYFFETVLPEKKGGRIIIFTDMMNDDSDCPRQYIFPEKAITDFGQDKNGQLIFLYPSPILTQNAELNKRQLDKQQEFMNRMNKLNKEGKVRVFFYHIPDDPLEALDFIKSQFQNCIPTTMFDMAWERTSKVFSSIVSAVRG